MGRSARTAPDAAQRFLNATAPERNLPRGSFLSKYDMRATIFIGGMVMVIMLIPVILMYLNLLFYRPVELRLDDIASWGLRGPSASALPNNARGIYYLSGNQDLQTCTPEVLRGPKRDVLCGPGGYMRSSALLLDTSHCEYHGPETSRIVCRLAYAVGFDSESFARKMLVARPTYSIVKDAEFSLRKRHLFEGVMHLSFLGISANRWGRWLGAKDSRVTMTDIKRDGSRIQRLTWWIDNARPRSKANADSTYTMKRVLDAHGHVDMGVLREMKRAYGESVFMNVARFSFW